LVWLCARSVYALLALGLRLVMARVFFLSGQAKIEGPGVPIRWPAGGVDLSVTLPENYVAHNWPATWVGFDILLMVFMAATAVLGYLRRQLLVLAAFTAGVLLICDAWFDLLTAGPNDVRLSVITALGIEVPLAVLLISGALRLVRLTVMRFWLLKPGMRLWQLPLFP